MTTLPQTLQQAVKHHQAGELRQAEQLYRQVLQADPDHVEALHFFGLLAHQVGRPDIAAEAIGRAVRLRPDHIEALTNLGVVLKAQGKLAEAVACYERAVRLRPDHAEAHNNLGVALQAQGKLDDAQACFEQALRLRPDYADAHHNQAFIFMARGRPAEAVASYRQLVRLRPEDPQGHHKLAMALVALRRLEEAVVSLREVVRLVPDQADVHHSLGLVLVELGRPEAAVSHLRQAVRLRPDQADVHHSLGLALIERGELEAAVASFQEALRLRPDHADAHNNLGLALKEQGRLAEAVASLQHCLRLQPDHAEAHNRLALTWLLMGDFRQGWAEYEWRWKYKHFALPPYRQPLWDGTPLEGRTILLHIDGNDGFGDVMQFIRFALQVRERGGRVLVAVPPRLLRLLAGDPGIDHLCSLDEPLPAFDVFAPLTSLPRFLGTTLDTVPARVPYLSPDPSLREHWQTWLGDAPGLKVGIAWQGNPRHLNDRNRSAPLTALAPLSRVAGVRLFSLQSGYGSEQLAGDPIPVTALSDGLLDFAEVAAIMTCLDLVISVDTVVAHLAGALAVPVWIALSYTADWRWFTERQDSPWYPTARLFRQTERGCWEPVFERIASALARQPGGGD
jgi:tetratricopeptide (TPR) repeat protein